MKLSCDIKTPEIVIKPQNESSNGDMVEVIAESCLGKIKLILLTEN